MPRSFLIKKASSTTNYSHCPLKKRPVHIIKDESEHEEAEPENLSTKPEDLSLVARRSESPPSPSMVIPSAAPLSPPAYYCKPGVLEPLSLNTPAPEQICWPPMPQPRQFYPPQYAPLYPRRPPLYPPPALSPYAPPRAASASPPARLFPAYAPPFPDDLQTPALPQPRGATELLSPSASSSASSTEVLGVEDLSRGSSKRGGGNGARYQCPACSKSYSSFSGLSKHRTHHCPASAGSESAAADQANNNAVAKSFSCKYCEKTYVSLGALKMHIRTHTLPCKCKLCGKAFSRPWLLQGHIRTHTGEKPFACQHCRRAFADRSNLRAHLQTHSDVKKYSCQHCSKTFSRMSLLGKHMDGGCPGVSHPGAPMSPTSPPQSYEIMPGVVSMMHS